MSKNVGAAGYAEAFVLCDQKNRPDNLHKGFRYSVLIPGLRKAVHLCHTENPEALSCALERAQAVVH